MTSEFATTHWSLVLAAGQRQQENARAALESLCFAYWGPLYAYARRRVESVDEAQDFTQEFFAELLEKNYFLQAQPERGKFRAFLLTAFKHFLSRHWEKARAQKRGGHARHFSLNFERAAAQERLEPADQLTAEQIYDREWALTLLERVMQQLEEEQSGARPQFAALKDLLIGEPRERTYAQIAAELGMTEAAVKMAVSRMRRRYRRLLRAEIANTVSSPEDVEQEIGDLFEALGRQH